MSQGGTEDRDWQRLDKWLWCARFMRARADCARLVARGRLRINRQPTDKPHARLRPGDVITLPLRGEVRVIESFRSPSVVARPGSARPLSGDPAGRVALALGDPCGDVKETAYPPP